MVGLYKLLHQVTKRGKANLEAYLKMKKKKDKDKQTIHT